MIGSLFTYLESEVHAGYPNGESFLVGSGYIDLELKKRI